MGRWLGGFGRQSGRRCCPLPGLPGEKYADKRHFRDFVHRSTASGGGVGCWANVPAETNRITPFTVKSSGIQRKRRNLPHRLLPPASPDYLTELLGVIGNQQPRRTADGALLVCDHFKVVGELRRPGLGEACASHTGAGRNKTVVVDQHGCRRGHRGDPRAQLSLYRRRRTAGRCGCTLGAMR